MESQGMQTVVETTSRGVLRGSPRKLAARKSGKYTFSSSFVLRNTNHQCSSWTSVTTATDTALLRVVMAAVEGTFYVSRSRRRN